MFLAALIAMIGLTASTVWAAAPHLTLNPFVHGSVKQGALKSATCVACHGPNGNSTNPIWPRLAGQSAIYLDEQLHLFKAGVRTNPVMMPMAAMLSNQDIDNLSVYYEAQTPKGDVANPAYWKAGRTLYMDGDRAKNIPACRACHGPMGLGNLASGYPALRAQHAKYVIAQLEAFASGKRYAGAGPNKPQARNGEIMPKIAKLLTPKQMRDVASYVQGMR